MIKLTSNKKLNNLTKIFLLLTVCVLTAVIFSVTVSADAAPKVGDIIGNVLYSDITAYINGQAIPTSVIQGQTLVVVEDLARYGFDVVWDAKAKTLSVELNAGKKFNPLTVIKDTVNKPGTFKQYYYYTNIKTYISGDEIPSYSLDGRTLMNFELLKKYGKLTWDARAKTISLNIENNSFNLMSVTANGSSSLSTTQLTLIFDKAVPNLSVSDITLTGAAKGTLLQTAPGSNIYLLNISNIMVSDYQYVSVAVNKYGYTFSPSRMDVQVRVLSPITINSVVQENGSYSSSVTTQLRITLDRQIPGLTSSDIIIDVPTERNSSAVTKGALSNPGNNNQYILPITFNTVPYPIKDGDVLTVRIVKTGYSVTPAEGRAAVVYNPDVITVNYNVYANGSTLSPTTQLTIIFDRDMTGRITEANIGVSPVSARGLLSGSGSVYYLPITPVATTSVSAVTVNINNLNLPGYRFNPERTSVTVYVNNIIPVTDISGVPTTGVAGTPLILTGLVNPSNATNKTILWSVVNAGTTGASIRGVTLNTTAAGTAIVRATIAGGLTTGDFVQDYSITFTAASRSLSIALALGSSNTIVVGGTTQLTAVKDPANMPVTWYIKTGSEYATIDQTGKVTAITNNTGTVAYVTVGVISNDGVSPQLSAEFIILISPISKPGTKQ